MRKSALYHEKLHYDRGYYEKENFKFDDHLKVYEDEIKSIYYKNSTEIFQMQTVAKYSSYLLETLNIKELTSKQVINRINKFNKNSEQSKYKI